eukprot:m.353642 g.353642  ORF g.353642 m.353642 type:complete len:568 (-) comp16811_c0_seq1:303-2006(-)
MCVCGPISHKALRHTRQPTSSHMHTELHMPSQNHHSHSVNRATRTHLFLVLGVLFAKSTMQRQLLLLALVLGFFSEVTCAPTASPFDFDDESGSGSGSGSGVLTTVAPSTTTVSDEGAPVLTAFTLNLEVGRLSLDFDSDVDTESVDMTKAVIYENDDLSGNSYRFTGGVPISSPQRRRATASSVDVQLTQADVDALKDDNTLATGPKNTNLVLESGFVTGANGKTNSESTPQEAASVEGGGLSRGGLIALIVIAALLFLLIVMCLYRCKCQKQKSYSTLDHNDGMEMGNMNETTMTQVDEVETSRKLIAVESHVATNPSELSFKMGDHLDYVKPSKADMYFIASDKTNNVGLVARNKVKFAESYTKLTSPHAADFVPASPRHGFSSTIDVDEATTPRSAYATASRAAALSSVEGGEKRRLTFDDASHLDESTVDAVEEKADEQVQAMADSTGSTEEAVLTSPADRPVSTDAATLSALNETESPLVSHAFVWKDLTATSVQVVTSHDDWQEKHPLAKTASGFMGQVEFPPGTYEFRFVVDGKWTHSKDLPSKENGMGGMNNVFEIDM